MARGRERLAAVLLLALMMGSALAGTGDYGSGDSKSSGVNGFSYSGDSSKSVGTKYGSSGGSKSSSSSSYRGGSSGYSGGGSKTAGGSDDFAYGAGGGTKDLAKASDKAGGWGRSKTDCPAPEAPLAAITCWINHKGYVKGLRFEDVNGMTYPGICETVGPATKTVEIPADEEVYKVVFCKGSDKEGISYVEFNTRSISNGTDGPVLKCGWAMPSGARQMARIFGDRDIEWDGRADSDGTEYRFGKGTCRSVMVPADSARRQRAPAPALAPGSAEALAAAARATGAHYPGLGDASDGEAGLLGALAGVCSDKDGHLDDLEKGCWSTGGHPKAVMLLLKVGMDDGSRSCPGARMQDSLRSYATMALMQLLEEQGLSAKVKSVYYDCLPFDFFDRNTTNDIIVKIKASKGNYEAIKMLVDDVVAQCDNNLCDCPLVDDCSNWGVTDIEVLDAPKPPKDKEDPLLFLPVSEDYLAYFQAQFGEFAATLFTAGGGGGWAPGFDAPAGTYTAGTTPYAATAAAGQASRAAFAAAGGDLASTPGPLVRGVEDEALQRANGGFNSVLNGGGYRGADASLYGEVAKSLTDEYSDLSKSTGKGKGGSVELQPGLWVSGVGKSPAAAKVLDAKLGKLDQALAAKQAPAAQKAQVAIQAAQAQAVAAAAAAAAQQRAVAAAAAQLNAAAAVDALAGAQAQADLVAAAVREAVEQAAAADVSGAADGRAQQQQQQQQLAAAAPKQAAAAPTQQPQRPQQAAAKAQQQQQQQAKAPQPAPKQPQQAAARPAAGAAAAAAAAATPKAQPQQQQRPQQQQAKAAAAAAAKPSRRILM